MPNIRISGMAPEKVQALSKELTDKLAEAIEVSVPALTFYAGDEKLYRSGELLEDCAYVYVGWFDKGEEIKRKIVDIITTAIIGNEALGLGKIQTVRINFEELKGNNYYKNGERLY